MNKFKFISKNKIENLPKNPGVYAFNKGAFLLYIGKAANIKERVRNHFPSRSEGERKTNVLRTQQSAFRDNLFINQVVKIGYIKTNSEIEALILEANLIKKYQPKYNVVWKDDKNYFFVGIIKGDFPQVFITHQPKRDPASLTRPGLVGPFVDGKALKQTLKVLRKVFPYRTCRVLPNRPCLWHQLNRCLAPCLSKIQNYGLQPALHPPKLRLGPSRTSIILRDRMKKECQGNARNLMKILQGKKTQAIINLKKEMKRASKLQDFERAAKIRDQIESLEKVLAHAKIFEELVKPEIGSEHQKVEEELKKLIKKKGKISRIEAYDISNIQGQEAAGSMVTFIDGTPNKNFYRKFKIKIARKPNDIAMLKECLARRFGHPEWPFPNLILIDGGIAQLNAALNVLNQHKSAKSALISVVALAKKRNELFIENQKKPILLKSLPREIFNLILQLRDEAHRFARKYHHKLREIDLRTSF